MSDAAPESATHEIADGRRFAFGENWTRFLGVVDETRVASAVHSLEAMLGAGTLSGRTFLDAGSGSGLFSLAARRLGATVTSFDFDPSSVGATTTLRERFAAGDAGWRVLQGSVLDAAFVESLGRFDVVYSWGVLHHTGQMWRAVEHAADRVAPGGRLFIALYNDQGWPSRGWHAVKRAYCSGAAGRVAMTAAFVPYFVARGLAGDAIHRRNPVARYADYKSRARGMSVVHDWIDWLGGLPFEVARPDAVVDFLRPRGFVLERLVTAGGGLGCNEFVFRR